jgi:hypothetical protein
MNCSSVSHAVTLTSCVLTLASKVPWGEIFS